MSSTSIRRNIERLTDQIWKLIPMREKEEDWKKQLDTVIIEIAGLNEIFIAPSFLQLLSKLEGLKIIREVADKYGMAVETEIMEISQLDMILEYVDILQVNREYVRRVSPQQAILFVVVF